MQREFRGFADTAPECDDLFGYHLFREECEAFLAAVVNRLKERIRSSRWVTGRDQRGGRDYYYSNFEVVFRARQEPAFIGFFHYGQPDDQAGSFYQVWAREHDDDPVVHMSMPAVVAEARKAWEEGTIAYYLTDRTEEIRTLLEIPQ